MPLVCVNWFMKRTNQCLNCYTFPCNVLLIHAVVWRKSGNEIYKSMPQLQINAVSVVRLIAQGWRQPTLGYACSEEVNAVGVVRFLRGMP